MKKFFFIVFSLITVTLQATDLQQEGSQQSSINFAAIAAPYSDLNDFLDHAWKATGLSCDNAYNHADEPTAQAFEEVLKQKYNTHPYAIEALVPDIQVSIGVLRNITQIAKCIDDFKINKIDETIYKQQMHLLLSKGPIEELVKLITDLYPNENTLRFLNIAKYVLEFPHPLTQQPLMDYYYYYLEENKKAELQPSYPSSRIPGVKGAGEILKKFKITQGRCTVEDLKAYLLACRDKKILTTLHREMSKYGPIETIRLRLAFSKAVLRTRPAEISLKPNTEIILDLKEWQVLAGLPASEELYASVVDKLLKLTIEQYIGLIEELRIDDKAIYHPRTKVSLRQEILKAFIYQDMKTVEDFYDDLIKDKQYLPVSNFISKFIQEVKQETRESQDFADLLLKEKTKSSVPLGKSAKKSGSKKKRNKASKRKGNRSNDKPKPKEIPQPALVNSQQPAQKKVSVKEDHNTANLKPKGKQKRHQRKPKPSLPCEIKSTLDNSMEPMTTINFKESEPQHLAKKKKVKPKKVMNEVKKEEALRPLSEADIFSGVEPIAETENLTSQASESIKPVEAVQSLSETSEAFTMAENPIENEFSIEEESLDHNDKNHSPFPIEAYPFIVPLDYASLNEAARQEVLNHRDLVKKVLRDLYETQQANEQWQKYYESQQKQEESAIPSSY